MKKTNPTVKPMFRRMFAAVCGAALLAAGMTGAIAQSVGLHFVSGSAGGIDNSQANSMLPTDLAGVPSLGGSLSGQQANWNNLSSSGSGTFELTNSAGAPYSFNLQWNSWLSDSSGSGTSTADNKLMSQFLSTWDTGGETPLGNSVNNSDGKNYPLTYISGLSAWYQAEGAEGYAVVLYTGGDNDWNWEKGYLESVSGSPLTNGMVEGSVLTPQLYNVNNSAYSGTYNPITGNSGSPTYGGNYMFFAAFTNDAVLVRIKALGWNNGLSDIQFVPVYPTIPTATAPTFSPSNTVNSGTAVTVAEAATGDLIKTNLFYQWQTDGGSGGALTNILNATNATVMLTPASSNTTYTINFQVIVTNFMGSVTSSVAALTVNPGPPTVSQDIQPGTSVYAFANGDVTLSASFTGSQPITNQWQTSSSYPLTGATNTTLTLSNLQASADGSYYVAATNAFGNSASSAATLTVLADPAAPDASTAYPYAVFTNGPAAYWRFNETTYDVSANSVQAYDYSGHNLNATYGKGTYPTDDELDSPSFPGFESVNQSVELQNGTAGSYLTVPPLNLNTNTVTISMWINPNSVVGTYWGLLTWANTTNGDKAGFGFGSTQSNSVAELGYTWNTNSPATYGFHSGLYPPTGKWSFVSLVITPTNSTIYLYYTDGSGTHLSKAVQAITNSPEAFGGSGGTVWIGMDGYTGRTFDGFIDEVSVFNKSLSEAQIQGLFSAGSGVTGLAPFITSDISANPTNTGDLFPGQVPIQLTAAGEGMPVPAYIWQAGTGGVFTNLVDGGSFAGSGSGVLNINPVTPATYLDYRLLLTNVNGSATSSVYTVSQVIVPTNGLWTARFQVTPTQWGESSASGSFTGLGVLGSGTYWNSVSAYGWGGSGTFSSATSYQDNGSTNSGITCTLTGGSNVSSGPYATNDVRGLLSQVIGVFGTGYTTNSIALAKMPNGYYNMAIHGACAGWNDRGATFRVHGMNGDQIAGTTNTPQVTLFENYVTTVLFTNVEVTNGILNVDVEPTPIVPSHNPNTEGYYNGVEVQLVSYGPPTAGFSAAATNVAVGQWFEFYDQSSTVTNVVWDFGDGNVDSTVNGNVYHGYSTAGTYTVSQTVTGPGGTASVTNVNYIVVTNVAPVLSTNAFLASLAVNPPAGTLPGFATNVYSYSVTNAYVNNPVQVTASSADTNATMTLTFNTVSAGSLTNGVAGGNQTLVLPTNTVVVQVVSQDLSQTNTYTVNVLLQPSQTVPKLTNSVSGNNLVLSWPADHLGYQLLVQTNNLNKGVSANISDWMPMPGSTAVTTMSIPIIKATNNAYYRLVYP